MDPVSPACPRTPLKDTTNQVLSGGVIAKKPDVLNSSPTCSPILRDQESEAENLPYSHHSTPRKVQDCDGESDTTGDYESAGEASPWKEKQVNISELADTLAEVHLSTPNPSRALPVLDHFPFSPITGEDEEDEEVISITSNRSNNSIGGSLSLLKNSLNGDKLSSSPSHLISSPRSHENSENPHLESENVFKALTSLGQNLVDLPLSIGNDGKVISPAVEFEDAGPTCSFHSESTNDISSNNLSLCANSSAIEDCAALTSLPADGVINKNLNTSSGLTMEKNFETIPLNSPNKVEIVNNELPGLNVPNLPSPRSKINNLSPIKYLPESNQIKPEHPGLSEENHQNNISISESVLRLANEIHPACIETSPENISKLTSPVKLLSTENVLNEDVSPSSSLVENIKENDKMISQMCDLIETTFNNTLTENIGDLGLEGSPNKLLQSIKVDATDDASPPLIFKLSQFEDIEIKNEAVECCDKKEIIETEISPADSICNAEQEPLEKSSIQHISMTIPETDVKGEFSEKIISSSPMISAVSDTEISKPLPVNSNLSVDKEKTFDSIESIGTNQKLEKPAPCLENIISSVAFKSDEVTESILKEDSSLCSKDHFDDCKSVVDVSEECLPPIPNPESGLSDVPIETSLETTKLNGSIQLENVLPTTNEGKSSTSNESFKEHLTTEKPLQVLPCNNSLDQMETSLETTNLNGSVRLESILPTTNEGKSSTSNESFKEHLTTEKPLQVLPCNNSLDPIETSLETTKLNGSIQLENVVPTTNEGKSSTSNESFKEHFTTEKPLQVLPCNNSLDPIETSLETTKLNGSIQLENVLPTTNEGKSSTSNESFKEYLTTEKPLQVLPCDNSLDPIETSLETTKLNGSIQLENVLPTTNDGKSSASNESFKEHLTTEKPLQVLPCNNSLDPIETSLETTKLNGSIQLENVLPTTNEGKSSTSNESFKEHLTTEKPLQVLPCNNLLDPIETSLETTKLNGSIQLENVLPTTNDGKSSTSNESFKEHLTTEKPSQVTEENIMSSPLRNGSLLESSEIKSLPNEETDPSLTEITTADRMNANVHEILSNQQELSFPSEVTVVSNAQETGGIKDISKFSTDASAVSISPQPESSSDHVLEELVLSDSVSNDFKQEVNEICINENQNSIPENINAIVIENSMILPVESTDLSLTAAENKLKHESQKDETLHNLPTSNKELPTNTSQENSPNIITSVSVEDTAIACNLAGDSITSAEDPTCVGLVEIKQENSLTSVHCTFDIDGHHQTREVQGLFSTCPQNDTNKGGVKSVPELQNLPDVAKSTPKSGIDLGAKAGTPATPCNPILPIVDRTCTPLSYGTPTSTPNETDKNVTSKSLIGSYEDLLDKCSQQERSLGFDDSFKDEAEKVIEELNNTPPMPESDPASSTITSQATSEPLTNGISFETNDLAKGVADAFQDASTFDFEFLSKVTGKSNHRLARESLFLKFDPLVSAPSPTVQDNLEATSQPDILIAPAADQAASNSITPSSPRRSPTSEILVPLTPVTSTKSEEPYNSPVTSLGQTPRTRRRPSAGQVTPTLRQEVLSKEISRLQEIMVNQEMSYQDQIAEYKEEIEELRQQLDYLQRKHEGGTLEELYEEEKAKRIMIEQEFRIFVEELEIFLNHTTQKKEELEKTQEELRRIKVLRENEKMQNEAMISDLVKKVEVLEQHLSNNELAFNDVHQKYERSKKAIESFLLNETEYKKVLEEYKVDRAQQLEKYKGLKKEATEKLEQANQEIKEMRSAHKAEISKLEVINRRLQVQVKTLNDSLEQKSREVQELTKICDELINKVSKS